MNLGLLQSDVRAKNALRTLHDWVPAVTRLFLSASTASHVSPLPALRSSTVACFNERPSRSKISATSRQSSRTSVFAGMC